MLKSLDKIATHKAVEPHNRTGIGSRPIGNGEVLQPFHRLEGKQAVQIGMRGAFSVMVPNAGAAENSSISRLLSASRIRVRRC